jgi:Protein of unknown function (DUF2798)
MKKLPPRFASIVLPLILTCVLTGVLSLLATLRMVPLGPQVLAPWLFNWLLAWVIAFPIMVLFLPVARRLTARIVEPPPPPPR